MSNNENPIPSFKIVVFGESNIGKTSLLYRYLNGDPPKIGSTFTDDIVSRIIDVDGSEMKVSIWNLDGPGCLRRAIIKMLCRGVDVLLMCEITNAESFQVLSEWVKELELDGVKITKLPSVCHSSECYLRNYAKVTREGQKYARDHNMLCHETSADTNNHVNLIAYVFFYLSRILKLIISQETNKNGGSGIWYNFTSFFKNLFS